MAADAGGGHNVGWRVPGEWLTYTVAVAVGGTFDVLARVASRVDMRAVSAPGAAVGNLNDLTFAPVP